MSGFAWVLVFFLKLVVFDAEFDSLSNDVISDWGHRPKTKGFTQNTGSMGGFTQYFLSGFAWVLGFFLKLVVFDAEFDSLSNGIIFDRRYRTKTGVFTQNTLYIYVYAWYTLSMSDTV